ncbi:MAG TPA: sigma-70 family RNA polymerase sigma factor [Terriglobales bacterium]|nr:sigma-70 family RNA polymerase sigma factor [Terriglobales bacterium]
MTKAVEKDDAGAALRERGLIARVLAGELELFYELIAPIERRLYFTALDIVRSQADAEEVAQEAILKAFRNLRSFRGDCKFSTWVFSITVNEARMRLRRNRELLLDDLQPEEEEGEYTPLQIADWREIPSEVLENSEMREHLGKAVASLGERYREVLILRDMNGLSIAETSKALNITEANVKVRLLRARLMLRDYFVEHSLLQKPQKAGRAR